MLLLLVVVGVGLPGCDVWTIQTQHRIVYQVAGYGEFPATVATRLRFTNVHGELLTKEEAFLPFIAGALRPSGATVRLEALVRGPARASGLQLIVIVDEEVVATDAVAGFDSAEPVTHELSLRVRLP